MSGWASVAKKQLPLATILIAVMALAAGVAISPYLVRLGQPNITVTNTITVTVSAVPQTTTTGISCTSTTSQRAKWTGPDANVVSYLQAANFIGQVKTVEGTIVLTSSSKGTIFLNFHDPYTGYFTAVIFASDAGNFKFDPASFYKNKEVRITGTIQLYEGAPDIVVSSPSQVEVAYMGFNYP